MAIEAAWAFTLSVALTESISHFTGRPRPFQVSHAIHLLIPPPWNASYPSGHTATSFALAFIFLYADWRVGVVSLLIAVLTALGRISVGVHFPTDVLAGLILGFVSFAVVRAIHAQLYTRRMSTAARTHRHDF